MRDEETDRLVKEFLAKGGRVTKCPPKVCAVDESLPKGGRAFVARVAQRQMKMRLLLDRERRRGKKQ